MNIIELNQEVASRVKDSSKTIVDTITNKFVTDEVNRRADLLTKLIVAVNAFRKEVEKIKPDLISHDGEGKVVSENWSKSQLDKKRKATEKIANADQAFNKALNSNDYNGIEKVIDALKVTAPSKPSDEDASASA